jgi:starvation-inducible DNA-binding protein
MESRLEKETQMSRAHPNVREETFRISQVNPKISGPLPRSKQAQTIDHLNSLLANEFALFTKTLNYHWNVSGPRFHSIHGFLDDQYHDLLTAIDRIAERVREIDGQAMGTLAEFKKRSTVTERPGVFPETSQMIAELVSDHDAMETQIKGILNHIKLLGSDPSTEDIMVNMLKMHERLAWKLKAHLT